MAFIADGTELKTMQCGVCGCWHAIPQRMYDQRREEGGYWSCPNGHQWGFREGRREQEATRLERDRLKQQAAQKDDEIRAERNARLAAERQRDEARTKHVNARKRAGAGTCPCCKRTISQLARHMATKHPTFKAEMVQ